MNINWKKKIRVIDTGKHWFAESYENACNLQAFSVKMSE